MNVRGWIFAPAAGLFAACGGVSTLDSQSGDGAGGSGDAALEQGASDAFTSDQYAPGTCGAWASGFCLHWSECWAWEFLQMYGDLGKCTRALGNWCEELRNAPGMIHPALVGAACGEALASMTCRDFLLTKDIDIGPPECVPAPGSLPNGSACMWWQQCQSGVCTGSKPGDCGVCEAGLPEGSVCTTRTCGLGLDCLQYTQQERRCMKGGSLGDACGDGAPCALPHHCASGVCAVPAFGGKDAPCDWQDQVSCNIFDGLTCDSATGHCTFTSDSTFAVLPC